MLQGRGSGQPGGGGVLVSDRRDLKNFRLRARLRVTAAWGGAIEVRRTAEGELASGTIVSTCRWPEVAVATAGSLGVLDRHPDGVAPDGWFAALPTPIKLNTWFDLMIDVYGETVVTWVNGTRVCESTSPDGSHPSGAIALTTGPNATLQYQSITLEEWVDGPGAVPSQASGTAPESPGRPPTPAIETARRVWAGQDLTFENYEPGRWRELNDGHRRIFDYEEIRRTASAIELFDPCRGRGGITVRLVDGKSKVRTSPPLDWAPLADGRWTTAAPAVARITTDEAVGRLEADLRKLRDPENVAARGLAFREVVDKLIPDFEGRLKHFLDAGRSDASGLVAWSRTVRDSRIFRPAPVDRDRLQELPQLVNQTREIRKQLGEVSYDVESLVRSLGDPAGPSGRAPAETGFVPLFNGRDLDGWSAWGTQGPQDEAATTESWSVRDGAIVGERGPSYLYSPRGDYKNFRVRAEV
ncbi:MAG TPA: family 16 glycoside hydrolase, partial [Isosphaeraceae bacterium]